MMRLTNSNIIQVELRDHDHTVECIAWAGESASQTINEAAGTDNKTGSHHGPFLASGSRDKSIRVQNTELLLLRSFTNIENSQYIGLGY